MSSVIPIELARELARQGEVRLTALTMLATAADSRATTVCGIFGAASITLAAAVLINFVSAHPTPALILGGSIASLGLFMAATIAARAAQPSDFFITGGSPDLLREWAWSDGKWREETELFDAIANRYAESIKKNGRALELSSKRFCAALWVAGASPLIAVFSSIASIFLLPIN